MADRIVAYTALPTPERSNRTPLEYLVSAPKESAFEEFIDSVEDLFIAVLRWVTLVAAIAIGTFLGLMLFTVFVAHNAENNLKQIFDQGALATTTSQPSSTSAP